MATSDLRQFYFYFDYVWRPEDFQNLQTWIWGAFQSVFEGHIGPAVLSGLNVTSGGTMTLQIDPGIAVGEQGQVFVAPTSLNPIVPLPGGANQNSLIVLRPTSTDMDFIPMPDNISVDVPLDAKKSFQVVVLNKVPAFEGDYPTPQSGDCVVGAVRLLAGATVINPNNIYYDAVSRPRKRIQHIKPITVGYSVNCAKDDIVEYDATSASGVVQLPPAASAIGLPITVVKVDSSINVVAVSGNMAETIAGQNVWTLDSQWDKVTLYSNGLAWRII